MDLIRGDKMQNAIIVGGVITKDDKYLLVQEAQEKCFGKWNIPAGHLINELRNYEWIIDCIKALRENKILDLNHVKIIK